MEAAYKMQGVKSIPIVVATVVCIHPLHMCKCASHIELFCPTATTDVTHIHAYIEGILYIESNSVVQRQST